ncbi:hypothetical protein RUM43_002770 [Polyplax serrata]|uniref:cGMP-dependent protein kinase interacting domain-containing protein n=1 Tax=Polyplax serrata TaxID=468196 RepID=A0AAN8PZY3_POLSC
MSYQRTVGSSSRRPTGLSSLRTSNRPRRSGYFSSGNGYSSFSGSYGAGNSLGHSYGSNSYNSYGSYHPSSYSNYGNSFSSYGGTSSGYGTLYLPSSSNTSGSSSSCYPSPSSSFKHLSPGGYTKSISRSPTRSNMGSRSGSTSSLLSIKSEASEGYASEDKSGRGSRLSSASLAGVNDDSSRLQNEEVTENGEIDYKKLYEESREQNERLKEKLKKTEDELTDARSNLEKHVNMDKSSLSEMEKRERRALERKLSEMEEELKRIRLTNGGKRVEARGNGSGSGKMSEGTEDEETSVEGSGTEERYTGKVFNIID